MSGGEHLRDWVADARRRTLDLVGDLGDAQLMGPRLAIVNPLLWEIGHVAWFHEKWVLRDALGRPPLRADGDALWDSSAVAHDTRWDLPLPSRRQTLDYMARVMDGVLEALETGDERLQYLATYSVFHEDMHDEAFTYTRQTLGYPAPFLTEAISQQRSAISERKDGQRPGGDRDVTGGTVRIGAEPGSGFVFDNEKWAHPVELGSFRIARDAVTQGEFAEFVEDGGYARPGLWTEEGRRWLDASGATRPLYWRRADGGWERRDFDRWVSLEPALAVIHVNAFEAEAWCRWAGRRLPAEAEWEAAAGRGRYSWGEEPPSAERANLDGSRMGCVDASALLAGDSPAGCRQMLGNVWEWTSTPFAPYAGFVADMYSDYSQPWFHTHRVLRGGCWVTRSRLIRTTWRNFYTPDRRDVWAGFRSCAR